MSCFAVQNCLHGLIRLLTTAFVAGWAGSPMSWSPDAQWLSYTVVNLGASFLAGAAGGYITAWAGAANPLIHVLALGLIILALAALSALQSRGLQPILYQ